MNDVRPALGDWHDPTELAYLQDAQLGQLLASAAHSPFYRQRGVPAGRAELAQYPLTTKEDLRDAYPFGMLAVDRAELATYHESSGSSGAPTASYYTAADWLDLAERYARKHVGIHATDTFLVRTPYALMITGHLAHAAARSHGATVVPADNRSLATPYAKVVRVLHDLGVSLTWSLPTDTLLWAASARLRGLRPEVDFPSLRALFVGGEPLSAARRARIAQIWNTPVVEEYGATETGSLAGECPHGRLHLWADRAIFEVHDPGSGRCAPYGRGQLVVTPLYRSAMPLLRYNIEDEVEISDAPCACGWALPSVRVLGRARSGVHVRSVELTQLDVEEIVFRLPAEYGVLFWRARPEPPRLRVQIEVDERFRSVAARELRDALHAAHGIDTVVDTVPPGGLVPAALLTAAPDVMKPRSLFGPADNWDKALQYY
ncbi:phenylacetate--CoA ligase family protein [Winogradskya humida]|uniref:Phenylacetate--CoA ligase n=1 Tax=Winogradskya humida TaxID=113566 RepID=A0ABQ3ZYZ0_9ACTN|nr:AMP-binding protein [Actinoplanes humidus]GIE23787.1 phenylacetate--CoA ligase [Actinoplanes humidus]